MQRTMAAYIGVATSILLALSLNACRRSSGGGDGCVCVADGMCCMGCGALDPDCTDDGDGGTDADADVDGGGTCLADGTCNPACEYDPDCGTEPNCSSDSWCNTECEYDPDCGTDPVCSSDSWCNPACEYDPDCDTEPNCGYDSWCNPDCYGDDPDCDTEPACGYDSWCNPDCYGDDPDCEASCEYDSYCEPSCGPGEDPDCNCGTADTVCCESTSEPCVAGATCVTVSEGYEPLCLAECTPSYCDYGSAEGVCMTQPSVGGALCWASEGSEMSSDCYGGDSGCTTDYGETYNTHCIEGSADNFCLEECTVGYTGCASTHACVPLTAGGGACLQLT